MDAKTRFAKVDGEKLPEFPRGQFNKLNGNRKSQADIVSNKTEAKPSNKNLEAKVKRDIVAENITKQGKKLHVNSVKRIPATNNFVYEFNPFVNVERSLTSQTHLWRANNSEQILPHFKTDTTSFGKSALNHNANLAKQKFAVLPELNSRTDFATIDPGPNITNSSPTKNTCLPILDKDDPTRVLNKPVDKEYERSDIDREVENVKSAWQTLREEKYWAKGKDRTDNVRTKTLYETLEKLTCEIDKVQRNYMEPKTNRYLRRSATNVLGKGSKSNLQEEAEILRGVIFPDRKARIKSAVFDLRNVDSEIIGKDTVKVRFDEDVEDILTDKPHKNFLSSKYNTKKRSIHTNVHDIVNDTKSVHATASNICNKNRDTTVPNIVKPTDGKMKARIKSSIEEYLQRYSDNVHKSRGVEEEERSRDVKPSASDIADILASHDIGSHENLYENFDKHSDDYDSDNHASDENRFCSTKTTSATQVTPVDIQEYKKIHNTGSFTGSFDNTGLYNDTRSTRAIDARSLNTRGRSTSVTNYQDNAFIKMGLNKNLSKDMISQLLQSEYLRKDLSL